MRKFMVSLTLCLYIMITGIAFAQTSTLTPEATAASLVSENTREFDARSYRLEYVLDYYSLRLDCTDAVGDALISYPGIIDITPNDAVLYGGGNGSVPFIKIAVTEIEDDVELAPIILGDGPIIQYVNQAVRENSVQQIDLNGVDALRVDDLPVGQAGVSTHIVALNKGLRYDIIAEPRSGESEFGDALFEAFLDSFEVLDINE